MPHKVHVLKTHPAPFAAIRSRAKRFEYRKDDRDYEIGDTLWLDEFDPEAAVKTGQSEVVIVTYLLREGFGIPPGYVVMSIDTPAPTRATSEQSARPRDAKENVPTTEAGEGG